MHRPALCLLILVCSVSPVAAQQASDPVATAIAQGDLYQSKQKFDLALDAYQRADKLAHHASAQVYLKIATVERKLGDLPSAWTTPNAL